MKRVRYTLFFLLALGLTTMVNAQTKGKHPAKVISACSNGCKAKNQKSKISCKLTTLELKERKEAVIKSLANQILSKKELKNGFAYKFVGTDKMVDELTEFVKTERVCCEFFDFNLSISGDKSEAWLEIIGPKETKEFIQAELNL